MSREIIRTEKRNIKTGFPKFRNQINDGEVFSVFIPKIHLLSEEIVFIRVQNERQL